MERVEVLLKYYESAREEILLRVKWRDNWLRYQFILLAILCAVALGVKIFGVEFSGYHPEILLLGLPLSFITCSAYVIEEFSISNLTIYLKSVNQAECEIHNLSKTENRFIIYHWDGTILPVRDNIIKEDLRMMLKISFLKVRFLLLLISYVFLPLMLVIISLTIINDSQLPELNQAKDIISMYKNYVNIVIVLFCLILIYIITKSQYSRFKARISKYNIITN